MAQDYYDDSADMAPPASVSQGSEESATPEESTAQTAVLPKEFFSGKELVPGHECKIRIANVHENSVEVEYVRDEQEAPEEELAETPTEEAPMDELMA